MAEIKAYNMKIGRALKKQGLGEEEVKAKAGGRTMVHVAIEKTGNRYMAKGEDKETGDALSKILGEAEALAAIKSGHAVKSFSQWED